MVKGWRTNESPMSGLTCDMRDAKEASFVKARPAFFEMNCPFTQFAIPITEDIDRRRFTRVRALYISEVDAGITSPPSLASFSNNFFWYNRPGR